MILRSSKRVPPPEDKVQLTMEQQQETSDQTTEAREQGKTFTAPLQQMERRSRSSRSSLSKRSSTSSAAIRARAKAVAAQAQLVYAEKEASMIKQKAELEASMLKQKADLDASLHILKVERAAAVASAEAAAYEEAEQELESGALQEKAFSDMPPINVAQRTCEYVQQHSIESLTELPFSVELVQTNVKPPVLSVTKVDHTLLVPPNVDEDNQCFTNQNNGAVKKEAESEKDVKRTSFSHSSQYAPEPLVTLDLSKYLIRREMVSSGLLKFDDCSENYWAWKASFVNLTRELNLTAREELDLMVKWLGKDSPEQVKRIRSVHVLNATAAIRMAWQCLECYGAPEVIKNALLKKI